LEQASQIFTIPFEDMTSKSLTFFLDTPQTEHSIK
jgi:hypothetical protein